MDQDSRIKFASLCRGLRDTGKIVIAFSGGVDSSLLLKVACKTLGKGVLAVTAVSEVTPEHEIVEAGRLASQIGVRHQIVGSAEMSDPRFTSNPTDKCYICKSGRFGMLRELARNEGIRIIADGTNADDHRDYRPGMKALKEHGIQSPLSEAGLTKPQIRMISRHLGLPTWNKPASACLASRIPYHHPITAEKLHQIDEGEAFLRQMGITGPIRVRHHDVIARIEVDSSQMAILCENANRRRLTEFFNHLGFRYVTLDLEGYAMGSLNREILHP